jgi:hypothetical protein
MKTNKFLLLTLAGLIMTGCVVREGGGGYYGRGYSGGYEQRSYYDHRGDYERHGDYDHPRYWR